MELLLRGGESFPEQGLDGIRCVIEQEGQFLQFRSAEITKHVVSGVHPAGRPSHPYPDPQVVFGAQGLGDVPQPIVAALAATELELDRVEGDVDLIVDSHDMVRGDAVKVGQGRDRAAGDVHVAHRLGQDYPGAADSQPPLKDLGPGVVGLEACADPGGELVKDVQRDPVKQIIEHIDLLTVRQGEKVTVDVPVHVEGETAPGTVHNLELTVVSLEAEATHLPESVVVSIEGRGAGEHIHASDLVLPKGSALLTDAEALVVNISEATVTEEETEAAEAAEAAEEAPAAEEAAAE